MIIIVLLLQDKIVVQWKSKNKKVKEKTNSNLTDIMGKPKPVRSQSVPYTVSDRQIEEPEVNPDNLDIEYDENENVGIQIPQEELDKVFSNTPDLIKEEEEWNRYRTPNNDDDGLAQGVTFEELNSVEVLLSKEKLEPNQKETAIEIVQRLQGTELFSLLESSIEDASKRIAQLLNSRLPTESTESSSNLRNSDFDIEEFV